ncbi:DUF4258 domain-containing protein [Halogeometricum borinquense]|uniref:DUF4258 domain-containing protein n=1 Tax=Halogeometricum borinquense TaxID=60847 RepID=A0A6C0UIN9_9EURY|nr:DUF4258 domain-containing protein [Halogeometricum borinquense]QIB75352.1 DUF4258 domain-containing protein [Halogeometricum borinquense]
MSTELQQEPDSDQPGIHQLLGIQYIRPSDHGNARAQERGIPDDYIADVVFNPCHEDIEIYYVKALDRYILHNPHIAEHGRTVIVAVHGATVDIITAYDDDEPELYDGPGYRQLA